MQEIAQLLAMLVAYYATFAIMGIGFATMLAGKDGVSLAGNFFFLRPLQWMGHQVWFACTALLVASAKFVLHRVVDPFILAVERAAFWLVTRERGWLRRR